VVRGGAATSTSTDSSLSIAISKEVQHPPTLSFVRIAKQLDPQLVLVLLVVLISNKLKLSMAHTF